MNDLWAVRKGDRVVRYLGTGRARMVRTVADVTATEIVCGPWRFDRSTGVEKEDFGWGPDYGVTGSFIEPFELAPLRVRVRTATGSQYLLIRNATGMHWIRSTATLGSGRLRTASPWPLLEWPRVEIGEPVSLVGAPYVAGSAARVVVTAPVVQVVEDAPEERLS